MERRRRYDLVHSKLPDFSLGSFATEADTDVRKLHSFGKNKPEINLYSGRAINFNGVDQNCPLPDKSNEISFPYTVLWFGSGRIGDVKHNAFYSNGTLEWHDKATTYLITHFDKGQSKAITFHEDRIEIFVDGDKVKEVATNGYHLVPQKALGSRTATTQYLSGYLQDVIFINGTLSPNKIRFYSDRPEDFLYIDNGELKSKALTQDEIDNVVMFMPMCENDGFVRDYVNYSSTPFNTNTGENGFVSADLDYYHNVVADKSLNNDGSIRFQDNNANTNTPRFTVYDPAIGDYKHLEAGKYYLVKFKIKNLTDDVTLLSLTIDGDINCNTDDTSKPPTRYNFTQTTEPIMVMVKSNYGKSIGITSYCSGDYANKTSYFDLEYIIVTEATGVHELKNYTASMNLTKLQTGLQTYKWERDELGVPTGYVDGFVSEKYNSASTNIPFNGKYIGIEAILKLETIDGSTRLMLCARPDYKYYILQYFDKVIFYPKYNKSDFTLSTQVTIPQPNSYYHVYFELIDDGTNATTNTFRDGGNKQTRTLSNYSSRESNDIGKLFQNLGNRAINQGAVKLFNVYDKPQDPSELYAKRVAQGLIQH